MELRHEVRDPAREISRGLSLQSRVERVFQDTGDHDLFGIEVCGIEQDIERRGSENARNTQQRRAH